MPSSKKKNQMDRMHDAVADMLGNFGVNRADFVDAKGAVVHSIEANEPNTVESYPSASGPIYPGDTVEVWINDPRHNPAPVFEGLGRLQLAIPEKPEYYEKDPAYDGPDADYDEYDNDEEEWLGGFSLLIKMIDRTPLNQIGGMFEPDHVSSMLDRGPGWTRTLIKTDPARYDAELAARLAAWDSHCKKNGLAHRGHHIHKNAFVILCRSTKSSAGQNSLKPNVYMLSDWDASQSSCTLMTTSGMKTREVQLSEVDPGYYLRPVVQSDLPGYQ